MTEKQVKDYEKFVVRFPDGMRDGIAERAKKNGRSMNSEIVAALESWLSGGTQEGLPQNEVDRAIRIATKYFAEEISRSYDLVPKGKTKE